MQNINTKKVISYIALSIIIVISVAYFVFSLLNSNNNINPLGAIINSFILSILSIFFAIMCLFIVNSNINGKVYMYITTLLLTIFLSFNLAVDAAILKLPKSEMIGDFTNVSISEALTWATGHEIQVEQLYEPSDIIPIHHIINQTVTAGTLAKDITKIRFTISTGPNYDKQLVLPNMLGWKIDDVLKYIEENFLNNITVDYELSSEPKDLVIFQDRNGLLRRSDAIKLIFSLGNKEDLIPVELIDLVSQTEFNATLWLKKHGFNYNINYEFSDTIERHKVISIDKEKGTLINPNQDTINLVISKGKKIIVPNLLTMNINEVTKWIMNNKLGIKFSDQYDDKIEIGKIISTSHKVGSEIEEGTLINIVTSRGQLKMEDFTSLYNFREWANKYNIQYEETYEFSNTVGSGKIISFSHSKGQIIENNAIIHINVSQGRAVVIPNFNGKSKTYITNTCKSIGLSCTFTYGDHSLTQKDHSLYQSKNSGREVISGTSLTITLSKGPAQKFTLILQETLYTYGNSTASVNSLKSYLSSNYFGVTFNVIKKPHNLNSGLPHPDSPGKTGMTIEQGKTYTIWVIE